jgi:hypothetical protein
MEATSRLRTRAVGFMIAGATPTNAIAARYPEAPAWPTEKYSSAAKRKAPARTSEVVSVIAAVGAYL